MAVGDLEVRLTNDSFRRKLSHWTSAWADLRLVCMMLSARRDIASTDLDRFMERKALTDAAFVAYGRLFTDGTRLTTAPLLPMIETLGAEHMAVHDGAMAWRHRHLAHRIDPDLEHVEVSLLWGDFGTTEPCLRLRIETSHDPGDHLADDLRGLCEELSELIWRQQLFALQESWLAKLGPERLEKLRAKATPHPDRPSFPYSLRFTYDLGSDQPG